MRLVQSEANVDEVSNGAQSGIISENEGENLHDSKKQKQATMEGAI